MNIKYKILVSLFSLNLLLVSCSDDFLDEEIRSDFTPETLNDELGYQAQIIGLYQMLSTWQTRSNEQGWLAVWQAGTDIVWPTQPQGVEVPWFKYNQLNTDDSAANQSWELWYNMVENTNSIIYSIENNPPETISTEKQNAINAEARFFRALAYNNLATLFGGVPLILEPVTEARFDYTRNPIEEINKQIAIDLEYATANLNDPSVSPQLESRVNKYVANQLFAEYYLRIGDPENAEKQANIILNSGEYSLVKSRYGVKASEPGTPFSDMFLKGNQRRSEGNTEAIWVLENENPAEVRGGASGYPQHRRVWGAGYHNINGMVPADSLGGRGLSRIRLNNWVLYDLYDDGDMRNSQFSIKRNLYYNDPNFDYSKVDFDYGDPVPYTGIDTLFRINPYTLKWGQFDPNDVFGYGMWKDFILMRLGETYLLKAEAQVLQGKTIEAAETINALRERAGAPLVNASQMDLDFILDERVRELIGEENRRMTLMRTKMLVERATRLNTGNMAPVPQQMTIEGIQEHHELFPIPLREIQLNKDAVLEQNPGY
ncbi:RagB/SusD family nutrient uptake outer membrane protein [Zunongwangia pacifica]|uniref:RagB/SusD family nutrient uptake outer membrane protein n=1 Tax=Zunongwangia pacifica TaxID=2911062 RepID=A0A9X2CMY3_9FLAO|nr:RagB/SusD family nutrient uptake outer membrane protein [Zunongwangia pacifica]MCL6218084.1 RagB/SusD family nutrient uptake outer membrane protein [Zunongwangia pacifica]